MPTRCPRWRNSSSVHRMDTQSYCPTRLRTRFSHKMSCLHKPVSASCGSRGKHGPVSPARSRVFQIPSFAQLCFRKPEPSASLSDKTTSSFFPLFLGELRVLLSFSLFFYPFPRTRRGPITGAHGQPSRVSQKTGFSSFCRLGKLEANGRKRFSVKCGELAPAARGWQVGELAGSKN